MLLLCAGCQKEIQWPYYVSTYAGGNPAGPLEGGVDIVFFEGPNNLTVDRDGNLLVSDRNTHRVRKILPRGQVLSIAGNAMGFADGQGGAARFNTTRGLALDAAGNVYVADRYNHSIRKITPGGQVSTLAGDGTPGFADGSREKVLFSHPIGIAVDNKGHVYVADSYNNRIRQVDPGGRVSTVAGAQAGFADGPADVALFRDPVDIAMDAAGNLLIADRGNHAIRKITPGGNVSTLAGDGTPGFADGAGRVAKFNNPWGLAIDRNGNLYVGDSENNRIRRLTPDGTVGTIAGNGAAGFVDGPGQTAQFNRPRGVALDTKGYFLYVADRSNRRIRKISLR